MKESESLKYQAIGEELAEGLRVGASKTKDPKLEPCRCGRPVEVNYIAGLGRGVIEYVSNPFKSSYPTYYIHCPVCNRNLCIRITRGSAVEYRDRARRKLIRKWNAVVRSDIDLIPANTKNVWEVTK